MGTAQRTPTEARGARRAQRRPKARREPLTGGINIRMFVRLVSITTKVSGAPPQQMERRSS
jgi:hypothetical protein